MYMENHAVCGVDYTACDHDIALARAQRGLPAQPPEMSYVTVTLTDAALEEEARADTWRTLLGLAAELSASGCGEHYALCAVEPETWLELCKVNGLEPPRALTVHALHAVRSMMRREPFSYAKAHLFFHLKSTSADSVAQMCETIRSRLAQVTAAIEICAAAAEREGKVFGRRQFHGIIRSSDPYNLSARALIDQDDPDHSGGCFALTQCFVHDWQAIDAMSEVAVENANGRDGTGAILPGMSARAHIRRVRTQDPKSGINDRILTQGAPYGSAGADREEGVYFAGYAKSLEVFARSLGSMLGDGALDEQMTLTRATYGNVWYVPAAAELELAGHADLRVPINPRFDVRSPNGVMHYNSRDMLNRLGRQPAIDDTQLSPRILRLLGNTFSRWHNNWYIEPTYPDLGHLVDHMPGTNRVEQETVLRRLSMAERKGRTIRLMLGQELIGEKGRKGDVFRIDPEELIVGVLPPFTLGTGVRIMRYLLPDEIGEAFALGLDETSMAGHITPDHRKLCRLGIGGLMAEVRQGLKDDTDSDGPLEQREERQFLRSALHALEGVREWFLGYARLAAEQHDALAADDSRRENLAAIAERMTHLATHPPRNFHDAAQLVFGMHCCLHLIGELISLGRLDQVLQEFFDPAQAEHAQEVIDAFWIKMDEKVLMNRHFFPDWRSYGTCAVPYVGGAAVPQGDKASQWVQQCTIGGWQPTPDEIPEDGCNDVTLLCLRAARRLPLNAPCLSLRVNDQTPDAVVREAARAILSGGAHPWLFNDHIITENMASHGGSVDPARARDYCADGCWEPIFFGASEFALTYTPVMPALEAAINEGCSYFLAGPTYLNGGPVSYQSPPARVLQEQGFEAFLETFFSHYRLMAGNTMRGFIRNYGNLWKVCPSPLLSTLVEGCVEAGRDLTNGGALHHILAPMIFGAPCAIDSLYAIRKLCFDPDSAVTSLPELREALMCDWGYNMIEPIQNAQDGPERAADRAVRYKRIRKVALGLPKFGHGDKEVDAFAGEVASRLAQIFFDTLERPREAVGPGFAKALERLKREYSLPGRDFEFKLTPAFGTFEDYLGLGETTGASADGRRKGETLSSNLSPMPSPADAPPRGDIVDGFAALRGWNGTTFKGALRIPGPVDIDIPEETSSAAVEKLIRKFAAGELGFNLLTVSCNDRKTLEAALADPEAYDLLRLRMGGWSEIFVSMFPEHQQQHLRRPRFMLW